MKNQDFQLKQNRKRLSVVVQKQFYNSVISMFKLMLKEKEKQIPDQTSFPEMEMSTNFQIWLWMYDYKKIH